MSAEKEVASATQSAEAEAGSSLLSQVVEVTKQTERNVAEGLIKNLVGAVTAGMVSVDKGVVRSIQAGIAAIDQTISKQLNAVMHHPDFQKLEGSWRGLSYLVQNSETGTNLKLKVLNCGKKELQKDLERAVEFDQSQLFKKIYENEFGMPGGMPYGALIGDYEFENHPDDIGILNRISGVAAAAFCPFVSAASPRLMGFEDWTEVAKPRDLAKIFDTVEYTQWKSFRESEDSRFVVLTMPRTLARLPYGSNTKPIEEFGYEEAPLDAKGKLRPMQHDEFCWMNSAYVMGARFTDAFAKFGWCTSIRGAENGGKVEGLPAYVFKSDDGDPDLKCPTEVGITDRREAELSLCGLLPLCHYKNTDYSVFFGAQTTQKPKKYDRPDATANAAISSRLPYIMATSRIAHYLKAIARDKIGSWKERSDMEDFLDRWIKNYVCASNKPSDEEKSKFPLAEALIEVKEIPGAPGSYNAIAHLRPWLQLEELTTSLRLVASLPKKAG